MAPRRRRPPEDALEPAVSDDADISENDGVAMEPITEPEVEPVPEPLPEKPAKPSPQLQAESPLPLEVLKPAVALTVYLTTCGQKKDQIAGFRYWAQKHRPEKRSIPEWKQLHTWFNAQPTR